MIYFQRASAGRRANKGVSQRDPHNFERASPPKRSLYPPRVPKAACVDRFPYEGMLLDSAHGFPGAAMGSW